MKNLFNNSFIFCTLSAFAQITTSVDQETEVAHKWT
jgi:hypothetical protein